MNVLLLSAKDNELIHIDEVHELPTEQQTTLFLALDQRKLIVQSGNGQTSIPLAKFSLLLSTTDPQRILFPLRERMRLVLEMEYLTEKELAEVVRHRGKALAWPVEEAVLPLIACRARGTPRIALRILQSARRVARSQGKEIITVEHLTRACELDRIDCRGLNGQEQKYLQLLGTGSGRLNVLASCLGIGSRVVSEVIEPFLVRSGLLVKDKNGLRQLTQEGLDHLSKSRQRSV
jgi:Holliday junction DNA helicase RuvB